ncbi:hypothetical protein, partial [Streptomyces sp. TR02-1]|uniref:hypothetical protein n=1 Tax=Streptomyces sp. TR02-1 TaxID=3385977 RepID=UPI0039A067ED
MALTEHTGPDGTPAGLTGHAEYATDLFDHTTVETLLNRLTHLIQHSVTHPDTPLHTLELLTPTEHTTLTTDTHTTTDHPTPTCVHDAFAAAAA